MKTQICFSLFLLASVAAYADSSIPYTQEFNYLDDGMPESFELGQTVTMEFWYDSTILPETYTAGSLDIYAGAITDFSINVPDAGFSFTGGFGDILLNDQGLFSLVTYSDDPQLLDGKELVSATAMFASPFSGLGQSLANLSMSTQDGFELSFTDNDSSSSSYGLIFNNVIMTVPEPSDYALLASAVSFLFVCGMRLRNKRRA